MFRCGVVSALVWVYSLRGCLRFCVVPRSFGVGVSLALVHVFLWGCPSASLVLRSVFFSGCFRSWAGMFLSLLGSVLLCSIDMCSLSFCVSRSLGVLASASGVGLAHVFVIVVLIAGFVFAASGNVSHSS